MPRKNGTIIEGEFQLARIIKSGPHMNNVGHCIWTIGKPRERETHNRDTKESTGKHFIISIPYIHPMNGGNMFYWMDKIEMLPFFAKKFKVREYPYPVWRGKGNIQTVPKES